MIRLPIFTCSNRTTSQILGLVIAGFLWLSIASLGSIRAGEGSDATGSPLLNTYSDRSDTQPLSGIAVEGAILKTIESAVVAAQVVGVLQDLVVAEGSSVEIGEKVGGIDDEAILITLKKLRTHLEIARRKQENDIDRSVAVKNKEVAANEYQRALAANAKVPNTYPLNEIDRLRLIAERAVLEVERTVEANEMARLEVAVAASEYEASEELLRRHAIVSPMKGIIVAVEKHVGEWVEPGVELLRIVRTDRLRVEGFIDARNELGNMVGSPATIRVTRSTGSREVRGVVVFVSPDVNPVNSLARVFIEVDNRDGQLRPGLRVEAAITTN